MNKKLLAIFFGVAIAVGAYFYFLGDAEIGPGDNSAEVSENEEVRLNAFFDEVFEREVSQSPIQQAFLGRDSDQKGEWDDFSDAAVLEDLAETQVDLARLESEFTYDVLSDNGKLSYDLFKANLELTAVCR